MENRFNILPAKYIRFVSGIIMFLLLASCSSSGPAPSAPDSVNVHVQPAIPEDDAGYVLYKKHCLACHQQDGSGVPAMFPPLAKNPMVAGDPGKVIATVLHGRTGKTEVNGIVYAGMMAPFKHLPDEEIVLIVNYIRLRFGAVATPVTTAEVKKER
ncbi:MAG: cytochrome c [Bacteroidales bacterium]